MRFVTLRSSHVSLLLMLVFVFTFSIVIITEVSQSINLPKNDLWQIQSKEYSDEPESKRQEERIVDNTTIIRDYLATDAAWQKVQGTRHKFFVYSAYLDKRSKRQWVIRIIGATRTKNPDPAMCIFHYSYESEHVRAKIVTINENWSLPYSAVFIICALKNFTRVPVSVSIATTTTRDRIQSTRESFSNRLFVKNRNDFDLTTGKNRDTIAVCVKPIHFNFNKTMQLIEFIELNRLLGISHFTFYDSSIGSNANCVLNEYVKEGLVSLLPWKLNIKSKIEIRTEGIFASLNDCLYRNMYKFKYLAFIDIDEFIVPQYNSTLIELIRWLGRRYNTEHISSFSFQNAFFYLQWPDDEIFDRRRVVGDGNDDVERQLVTIRKTRRRIKLNAHKQRSKYIAKARNVVEVGNHFVWQFFPHQNTLNVPANVAILHHYRVCEFGGDDCVHLESTVDRTVHKYRKLLTCNVAQKWLSLTRKCRLTPTILRNRDDYCSLPAKYKRFL